MRICWIISHVKIETHTTSCIADGSVAILTLVKDDDSVTNEDLAFYATDSFTKFYAIARNLGTRSLNIDNNSVFFFGKLKQQRI